MDRIALHERIIATEYFLYGGIVDVPKVFDADTRHHSLRQMKGSTHDSPSGSQAGGTKIVDTTDALAFARARSATVRE